MKVRNSVLERELREKSSLLEAQRSESVYYLNKIENLREKGR